MPLDKHQLFAVWAPPESPWSAWAKPAVFAHLDTAVGLEQSPLPAFVVSGLPRATARTALVLDLPGPAAVAAGVALAQHGYRPVPLFNSCPRDVSDEMPAGARVLVDARSVLSALLTAASELSACPVAPDAPPAFLLDSLRDASGHAVAPPMFDNRSVVFAADFPSATFLRQHHIARARLIHDPVLPLGNDLRHALRHWHHDGIAIAVATPAGEPLEVTWPRNGFFGELQERLRALLTLKRGARGGFGRLVPEASGG